MDFKKPISVNGVDVVLDTDLTALFNTNGFALATDSLKVRTSATQAISAVTNTKVKFGTVEHALQAGLWSTVDNRFTARTAGIYSVAVSIRTTGTVRNNRMMLYKNGALVHALCDYNSTTHASPFLNGITNINLAANDYLEIWFYSSASTTIANSQDCNLCISRKQ